MQPLEILNNVQKARLLHSLLRNEMPNFISYLYEYTKSVLDSKEELRISWNEPLFGIDFWFELAEGIKSKIERYPKDLRRNSNIFADQLFDGYLAMFTVHVLTQYVLRRETELKFKQAVELLFS